MSSLGSGAENANAPLAGPKGARRSPAIALSARWCRTSWKRHEGGSNSRQPVTVAKAIIIQTLLIVKRFSRRTLSQNGALESAAPG